MRALLRGALLWAACALLACPAAAQESSRWEIGAFGGGYFGSRIALSPEADTRIGNGPTFGLRGAFSLNQRFRLEASLSRASVRVRSYEPASGAPMGAGRAGHVGTYELDLLYGFGGRRVRGYLGLGAGAMTLPSLPAGFAANVAAGIEVPIDERFALRLDGRYRWRESNRRIGAVICEAAGCFPFTTSLYSSEEVSGGVTYRFGGFPGGGAALFGSDDLREEPRRFWTAALEVATLAVVPFAVNKWAAKSDFAQITPTTVRGNLLTGFTYDRDPFWTNEFEHALHGNYYFNAARSNGYGFWESGVFAFMGSFVWECCTEIEPPAINDQLNTTLGGIQVGEIGHRLTRALLDNTATGSSRFFREAGAFIVDPIGAFNRLVRGETTRNGANPDDHLPQRFRLDCDLGYRRLSGDASVPDQGLLTVSVLYGDPFEGEIQKPFDSFTFAVDIASPADAHLSRVEDEGILKGWDLAGAGAPARHVFGLFLGYEYTSNEVETFATESVAAGLLSRYRVGGDLLAETHVAASVFPMAAIKTAEQVDPLSGRNYDFAPGGGLRLGATLRRGARELAAVTYGIAWTRTVDGISSSNTVQSFRASARLPLGERFGAGAGYQWYSRETSYPRAARERRSQSEWRVFLTRSL